VYRHDMFLPAAIRTVLHRLDGKMDLVLSIRLLPEGSRRRPVVADGNVFPCAVRPQQTTCPVELLRNPFCKAWVPFGYRWDSPSMRNSMPASASGYIVTYVWTKQQVPAGNPLPVKK